MTPNYHGVYNIPNDGKVRRFYIGVGSEPLKEVFPYFVATTDTPGVFQMKVLYPMLAVFAMIVGYLAYDQRNNLSEINVGDCILDEAVVLKVIAKGQYSILVRSRASSYKYVYKFAQDRDLRVDCFDKEYL